MLDRHLRRNRLARCLRASCRMLGRETLPSVPYGRCAMCRTHVGGRIRYHRTAGLAPTGNSLFNSRGNCQEFARVADAVVRGPLVTAALLTVSVASESSRV